jgi:hypothetical protein
MKFDILVGRETYPDRPVQSLHTRQSYGHLDILGRPQRDSATMMRPRRTSAPVPGLMFYPFD